MTATRWRGLLMNMEYPFAASALAVIGRNAARNSDSYLLVITKSNFLPEMLDGSGRWRRALEDGLNLSGNVAAACERTDIVVTIILTTMVCLIIMKLIRRFLSSK